MLDDYPLITYLRNKEFTMEIHHDKVDGIAVLNVRKEAYLNPKVLNSLHKKIKLKYFINIVKFKYKQLKPDQKMSKPLDKNKSITSKILSIFGII